MSYTGGVRPDEAMRELSGHELVALAEGTMGYVKELVDRCLEHDVPVMLGRPPGKGKS